MKEFFDIQVVLATPADFEQYEEQSDVAADKLNLLLHVLYQRAEEDTSVMRMDAMVQKVWDTWITDPHLIDLDDDEAVDWVDQLLASWEDEQP